jgi:WD40 repeat protein
MDNQALAKQYLIKPLKTISVEPQLLTLRYSPDGKYLVGSGYDARVRRWDATKEELRELTGLAGHNGWVQAIGFSADSSTLFTADSWGELRAWPLAEENPQTKWKVAGAHEGWIRDLCLSPDGNTLATCGADKTIRFWNPTDGAKKGELKGENDDLYCVRYSPDGQHILAGDRMGYVWQWEAATSKLARKFDCTALYKLDRIQDVGGARAIAFDKAGNWLAIAGMKPKNGATIQGVPSILFFDWKTGELKHTHDLGGQNDCDCLDLVLHEEGFFLAVTCGGPGAGKIVMQKIGEKEPFFTDTKYLNVQSLAWHPTGKQFAIFGTNSGSNGNGRLLDKEGKYPGNKSPLTVFAIG